MSSKCGDCWHVRYCETLSEWYCARYHRFLGYSIQPRKCPACDVIGQDGDVRTIRAMFDMLPRP